MAYIKKRTTKSGEVRYHVEYRGPDDKIRSKTFRRRKDAEDYRRKVETELSHGEWINPDAGKVTLREYADRWLASRGKLSPRTLELYEGELRLHIYPTLGARPMNRIDTRTVREWNAGLFAAGRIGPNTIAKCYRLLHTIFAAAVGDEIVRRNPCAIKDAGKEEYDERPIATVVEVFELAATVPVERRALVLLSAFSGLRLGELLALRRRHIDELHGRVIVRESTVELSRGQLVTKAPKSSAGRRFVHLDRIMLKELKQHLAGNVAPDPDAYLFTGEKGGQLRRAVWHREWDEARRKVGVPELHFHDLRHTHGTMVAQAGATTKETMRRLGQSTIQAAMIYQHATDERDQSIAKAIGDAVEAAMEQARIEAEKRRREADGAG